MGLTDLIGRSAVRHAHVLPVEVPGWWRERILLERAVLDRGWTLTTNPADADVLVVCGDPPDELDEIVERLWHQMPGPRARVELTRAGGPGDALNDARRTLLDDQHQRQDAKSRPSAAELLTPETASDDHGDMAHGDMDHSTHAGHGDMDHSTHAGHGDMDHSTHAGHGDMDMAPGGIPLATGGPDRDGLEMDVLHVKLGPVLAHWPAGLVLRCTLQGDLVVDAEASTVGVAASGPEALNGLESAVRRCDDLTALLFLAGCDDAARRVRRTRDQVMALVSREMVAPGDLETIEAGFREVRRRLRRSRILRWSLRRVGRVVPDGPESASLPTDLQGDSYDRLLHLLDLVLDDLSAHDGRATASQLHADVGPEALASLVTGLDLATARLVVASVGGRRISAGGAREVAHA